MSLPPTPMRSISSTDADADARRVLENSLNPTLGDALRMLRRHDLGAVADVAGDQARLTATVPRIVVVGETKRGKSSLVNALVGRPDLCPVGVDETSATYVSVLPLPSGQTSPWAEVILADGTRRPIELTQIPDYADLSRLDDLESGLPIGVEVHVRSGPLGDLILTDSPGIGGISGVRGRMNQRLAAETGCLTFVLDAGSPLTRVELDYLEECAATVEHVIVGVTMIDKYPGHWRQIVEDVGEKLRARSPRLGRFPVVGVSAHAAFAAQSAPQGSAAAALLTASGLPALIEKIQATDPRRSMPSVNALRTCRSALAARLELLVLRERVESVEPGIEARLQAHKEELRNLQSQQERWSLDLDRDLGRMRADLARELAGRLDRMSETWRHRIEHTPLTARKAYVRATSLDMAAEYRMVRQDIATHAAERLTDIVQRMFGDLLPDEVATALTSTAHVPIDERQFEVAKTNRADGSLILSASMGATIAVRIATFSLLGSLAIPVAVVGAGAWLAFNWAYRSNRLERQSLSTELSRTLVAERTTIMDQLDSRIREIKPELVIAYRSQLRQSLAQVQALIRDAEKAKAGTENRRHEAVVELSRSADELRTLLRDIDDSLATVHR